MRALHPAAVILALALAAANASTWRDWPATRVVARVVDSQGGGIDLLVTDDKGIAVAGAMVETGFYYGGGDRTGRTDTNGLFRFVGRAVSPLRCEVRKQAYYATFGELWRGPTPDQMVPPTNRYRVVLKKTVDPVPMLHHEIDRVVPAIDQEVGFDLQRGDWVAPHGKGVSTDVLVVAHYVTPHAMLYEKRLTMRFSHSGDGIRDCRSAVGSSSKLVSELPVPQVAPEDGYRNEMVQIQKRAEGVDPVDTARSSGAHVFRVRSVTDARGQIVQANYGWIVWGFEMGGAEPGFRFGYYFNPNPASRSLEPANLPRTREPE